MPDPSRELSTALREQVALVLLMLTLEAEYGPDKWLDAVDWAGCGLTRAWAQHWLATHRPNSAVPASSPLAGDPEEAT